MRRTFIVIMAFSLMLVAAAPAFAKGGPPAGVKPGDDTIAEIVVASTNEDPAEFTELLAALEYTDLTGVFTGGEQYTVFAPTDAAFKGLYDALGEDVNGITDLPKELVEDVLLYHVTEGRRASNSVVPPNNSRTITTLLGASFTVDRSATITDIAGQEVDIVAPNVPASNGVIHVIDTVLLPLPPA